MTPVSKRGDTPTVAIYDKFKASPTIEMMYLRIAVAPSRPKIAYAGPEQGREASSGRRIQMLFAAGVLAMVNFTAAKNGTIGFPVLTQQH